MSKLLDIQQQQLLPPAACVICMAYMNDKHSTDILLGSISIHTHSHSQSLHQYPHTQPCLQLPSVPTHTAVHRACTHDPQPVMSYPHNVPTHTHTLKHGHTQKRYLCLFSSLSLSYPPLRTWHLNCNVYQLSFFKKKKMWWLNPKVALYLVLFDWAVTWHQHSCFPLQNTLHDNCYLYMGRLHLHYPFLFLRNWTPQLSVLTSPLFSFLHVFLWYYRLIPYCNCHLYATGFEFLYFPWDFIRLQSDLLYLMGDRHSDAWQSPWS